MTLAKRLSNLALRFAKALFVSRPPTQLIVLQSHKHDWWGVELQNQQLRSGNVILSTGQASNTLEWFFNRRLAFEGETLEDISAFLASCRYVHDESQFRRKDWWIHPAEFEELKRGDCEDHALWAWRVLHERGHDVRLMLGQMDGGGHARVQIYEQDRCLILEATAKSDVSVHNADQYVPEYSFERTDTRRIRMFGHTPKIIMEANQDL